MIILYSHRSFKVPTTELRSLEVGRSVYGRMTDDGRDVKRTIRVLRDITDGLLYKKILNSEVGNLIRKKDAFTLTLNTDGINSTLSMWPVYTVKNEIKVTITFLTRKFIT